MSKPDAYALRNSQGFWVGIWTSREMAERVRAKVKEPQEVVEVWSRPARVRLLDRVRCWLGHDTVAVFSADGTEVESFYCDRCGRSWSIRRK